MIEYLFHQYDNYPKIEIYLEITAVIFGILSVWFAKKDNILVICRSGVRSMAAAKLLQQQGYKNLINISDGFEGNPSTGEGWKKSNLPCK